MTNSSTQEAKTHKLSSSFNFEKENEMCPCRRLNDKSLITIELKSSPK
jgi:hypothetical protein